MTQATPIATEQQEASFAAVALLVVGIVGICILMVHLGGATLKYEIQERMEQCSRGRTEDCKYLCEEISLRWFCTYPAPAEPVFLSPIQGS